MVSSFYFTLQQSLTLNGHTTDQDKETKIVNYGEGMSSPGSQQTLPSDQAQEEPESPSITSAAPTTQRLSEYKAHVSGR